MSTIEGQGWRCLIGTCQKRMQEIGAGSVYCCVTSPPYFGLRDYGHEDQIGNEMLVEKYVENLVEVFREVRRVLRDDGTLWLNLGDSYANGGRATRATDAKLPSRSMDVRPADPTGIKPKDLIGVPWRVAFALQADGWYLRQDIIWHKPNPMPESVRDRCTKAHEYLFLLSKSERYYFDSEAIKEPLAESSIARLSQSTLDAQSGSDRVPGKTNGRMKAVGPRIGGNKYGDSQDPLLHSGKSWSADEKLTRNKRSVWTITTKPFKGSHFATFPPDLIEPCILAGCPEGEAVLDPFGGSGTTAGVAVKHGRRAVLCELNPDYAAMIERRVESIAGSPRGLLDQLTEER